MRLCSIWCTIGIDDGFSLFPEIQFSNLIFESQHWIIQLYFKHANWQSKRVFYCFEKKNIQYTFNNKSVFKNLVEINKNYVIPQIYCVPAVRRLFKAWLQL